MLEASATGELFAAGFSEPGNDMPVFLSTTRAERADGGWRFTGTKVFTSLAPAWTRLAICGLAADHPDGPRIVHGFADRATPGITRAGDWNVMGMRATRSEATRLEDVFVADDRIIHVAIPGEADPHTVATFAWGLMGFANVYLGIAERAFAITVENAGNRQTLSLGKAVAHHPAVQHAVASMALTLQAVRADVEQTAADWQRRTEPTEVFLPRVLACKTNVVEGAWRVVDQAMDLAGGSGMTRGSELERLFRDARCGRFHPANAALTHEIVGKAALGLPLAGAQRWG